MLHVDFVSHLRNGQASNGESRDEIRSKSTETVTRHPLQYREKTMETQNHFPEKSLVLESVERIIREENLRQSVLEFLKCSFLGWQTNSMYLQRLQQHWAYWERKIERSFRGWNSWRICFYSPWVYTHFCKLPPFKSVRQARNLVWNLYIYIWVFGGHSGKR